MSPAAAGASGCGMAAAAGASAARGSPPTAGLASDSRGFRGRGFSDGCFSDGGGGLRAAGAAADRLLNRRFSGLCCRRLCRWRPQAPPRLRQRRPAGVRPVQPPCGRGSGVRAPWPWLRPRGREPLRTRRERAAGSAASAAASAASFLGSALRRVRTGRFGGVATAASADSAASLVTAESSLPVTTWSLSICGDTPAPDVPPHPAPVGANICQHPQALTEVNWIPSGSHRQWGAAALEGRRNCSETR